MENYLTFTNMDPSQDQTDDNLFTNDGFATTLAGDLPVEVEQNPHMDQVAGHVLYNQAAVCTTRFDKRISGTQCQRNFIQTLCATTPNQTCPLLSLEQCLSPRIFWSTSTADSYAVLGALPTWVYTPQSHPNGFAKIYDVVRTRITTPSSLTSTCPHYLRFQYDILANIALSKGDSRQIINRGFQVDVNSPVGLSVRNNNQSALTESVDSYDMVRGLAASQEYTNWDWFITFTCNHSKTPGVNFLHEWKKSEEWASQLDRYHTMPQFMKEEYKYAMEEASGPTILCN